MINSLRQLIEEHVKAEIELELIGSKAAEMHSGIERRAQVAKLALMARVTLLETASYRLLGIEVRPVTDPKARDSNPQPEPTPAASDSP